MCLVGFSTCVLDMHTAILVFPAINKIKICAEFFSNVLLFHLLSLPISYTNIPWSVKHMEIFLDLFPPTRM